MFTDARHRHTIAAPHDEEMISFSATEDPR
jgi:hypothetical protein